MVIYRNTVLTCLLCFASSSLLADFSYQESTHVTGGAVANMMRMAGAFSRQAREPVMSTVAVKDHKMARLRQDSAEIIDLDKQTITTINFPRKPIQS